MNENKKNIFVSFSCFMFYSNRHRG